MFINFCESDLNLFHILSSSRMESSAEEATMKLPQVNKNTRYYYRHREEIAAARKERLMADPEYVAKQAAKEAARVAKEAAREAAAIAKTVTRQKATEERQKAKEEEKQKAKEELKKQKRELKSQLVGATSPV
jgi:hypothetical protein